MHKPQKTIFLFAFNYFQCGAYTFLADRLKKIMICNNQYILEKGIFVYNIVVLVLKHMYLRAFTVS